VAALGQFVECKLMAKERDRYLSLAVATSPYLAAQRIRTARNEHAVEDKRRLPLCE
jgi:hypothetical protein